MIGFKIQTRIQAGLLAAAFALVPAASHAQAPTKAQQDAIRSNCRSDYMKNCSSVTPGGREALECLMRNKANVSGGCQGALNAVSAPAPAAAKPEPKSEPAAPPPPQAPAAAAPHSPEAPKAAPPAAAKPGTPKAAKAPARPSAPAQAAAPAPGLAAAPPPAAAPDAPPRPMRIGEAIMIRRFCASDFKVLCKGVQMGQGRAVKCLADNRPALSPGCKQAMAETGQ